MSLEATTTAPSQARRAIEPLAGVLSGESMEIARLLVSELVTNAVLHAGGGPAPIEMDVDLFADLVVFCVTDSGGGFAPGSVPGSAPGQPGGHGLELVAALASGFGIDSRDPFRLWFSLAR